MMASLISNYFSIRLQSLSDDISASKSPSEGSKKAFSSEFDAGDDGTIKIGGPKFLSG